MDNRPRDAACWNTDGAEGMAWLQGSWRDWWSEEVCRLAISLADWVATVGCRLKGTQKATSWPQMSQGLLTERLPLSASADHCPRVLAAFDARVVALAG